VIALLPSKDGAVNDINACVLPGAAATLVGGPGGNPVVTLADSDDALLPIKLSVTTEHV
jgi:hypothetical protein